MARRLDLGGVGVDLDVPGVRRRILEEGHLEIVRPAERIEHLHRAHHVRLRPGDPAGGVEGRQVAGRVGAGERRLSGVQIGPELDVGGGRGEAVDHPHVDRAQLVDVDHLLVGVERPALEIEAGVVAQVAEEILLEAAGAGVQLLAAAIGAAVDHEEAGAVDRHVGRRVAALEQPLLVDPVRGIGAGAARAVGRHRGRAGDQGRELRRRALVGHGVHVGDVVRDHAHRLALGGQAGDPGKQRSEQAHGGTLQRARACAALGGVWRCSGGRRRPADGGHRHRAAAARPRPRA